MPRGKYKRRSHLCKCGEQDPDKFYPKQRSECKKCKCARASIEHRGNHEFHRKYHLRKAYGWKPEKYDEELAKQHGLCALCGKPPLPGKVLRVDHDHETGETRGLIHQHCNSLLGFAREDTAILLAAIDYVVRYRKVSD